MDAATASRSASRSASRGASRDGDAHRNVAGTLGANSQLTHKLDAATASRGTARSIAAGRRHLVLQDPYRLVQIPAFRPCIAPPPPPPGV